MPANGWKGALARWTAVGAPSAIYGTVIGGAVMATGDDHTPVGEVAVAVLVTLAIYWAAERWSQALGSQVAGEPFESGRIFRVFWDGLPMVEVSAVPLLVMVFANLAGADDNLSVDIALGAVVVLLLAFGALAGRRAGLAGWRLAGASAATGGLGAALIVLETLTH